MIVTFKSAAAGDVIMFGDVARRMMEIMGKEPGNQGIITVEQLPDAITRLKAAIAADKAQRASLDQDQREEAEKGGLAAPVSLAQRAVPLLDLLEWSLKKNKPVVWGV